MTERGSMFGDQIGVRALLIGFFGFWLISIVASAVVIHAWLPSGVTDPREISRVAEADPLLVMWQSVLGTILGVLAGFVACHFSGAKGLKNSLVLGLVFTPLGVFGIFMHPTHPFI